MCCLSCVCILLKLCVYVLCGVQVRSRDVLLKLCVYIAKVVCVSCVVCR